MATKTALALLAQGTEEMELIITVDVLRRAGVSDRMLDIAIFKFILTLAFETNRLYCIYTVLQPY